VPTPLQYALVFDVGGSHISAALCAQGTYALRGLTRAPLPDAGARHFSAVSFVRLIHALGEAAAKAVDLPMNSVAGACIAMPGPFDYENGVSHMQHKLQSLLNFDLKSALAARFHWQPAQVRFLNDAAAFTLGESGAGAGKGHTRVLGLTLKISDSSPGNPEGVPPGGEMWNLPYNNATVEDFVSTRFLRQHYQQLTGLQAEVTEVAAIAECQDTGPCPPLEELVRKQQPPSFESTEGAATASPARQAAIHASTPARARQAFQDFGRHLGLALNQHAAAFRPDVIVLGGGISRASALFLSATRKALTFETTLAISTLMDEAPLAGAGVHWFATQPA
jgi:glucokinase